MENIYREWSIEDDTLLYSNRNESVPKLATRLGRGLRGVRARLDKLLDEDSPAYARLFLGGTVREDEGGNGAAAKLTPAKEILRRIRWDDGLPTEDFTVFYYDRVEDEIQSCSFEAPNGSVEGKEESFVFAIPEHRITSFDYKEQRVWDKETKLDRVFGSAQGNGRTIDDVVRNYDEWKREKEEAAEALQRRRVELERDIGSTLGEDVMVELRSLYGDLWSDGGGDDVGEGNVANDEAVDRYVGMVLDLCRVSDANRVDTEGEDREDEEDGSSTKNAPTPPPSLDLDALDSISNLVALFPNTDVGERILHRLERASHRTKTKTSSSKQPTQTSLPTLSESDLTEKFVRGSGAGGQKINKTASKVLLVHNPTSLRVECQDTRSLQQNRKIARKRLRIKLDEFMNGDESRVKKKERKVVGKKKKRKARDSKRRRKKEEGGEGKE